MCSSLSAGWFWGVAEPMEGAKFSEIPHRGKPPTSQELLHEEEIAFTCVKPLNSGVYLSQQVELIQNLIAEEVKNPE